MDPDLLRAAAAAVFSLHVGVILFNVFGLVIVPIGAWRGWAFVRVFWWRALHLALLALVAVQATLGKACVLTLWEAALERGSGGTASEMPLIQGWVERLLFWPLPLWFFALLYLAVFAYALALWRLVPPRRRGVEPRHGRVRRS